MSQQILQILFVEDDPNEVELTLDALREVNLANSIQVARDGEEALDVFFCRGEFSSRTFATHRDWCSWT
jgi:CheY-like chemotaxis protein